MDDFRSKRVALLGAGRENLSLVPHLLKVGATVFICEQDPSVIPDELQYHYPEVKLVLGDKHLTELGRYDYVFRSPGIPIERVETVLKRVKVAPIVTSATDLFFSIAPSTVIGVTGTKGKGTTATMIGEILRAAGQSTVVAGNIGKPIFSLLATLTPKTQVVLELSSFQLEDISHSPHVAVILPITEDHLRPLSPLSPNFHKTMNDYVAAKAHITLYQKPDDVLVFAADNPESTAIANVSKAKKVAVSQTTYQSHWNVNDQGIVYQAGEKWLSLGDCGLRGRHVFLNATMAIAAAAEFGVSADIVRQGLVNFKPLPHRLETIGEKNKVRYVDDSYATNPEATIAALTAFTEPIILIAGGSPKGVSFDTLAQAIGRSTVKAVVVIGQEAARITTALKQTAPTMTVTDGGTSMSKAVGVAESFASPGNVILLSPACASKDMFRDAADRGDQFKAAANIATSKAPEPVE